MTDLHPVSLPTLLAARYAEAIDKQDMATWRSFIQLADVELAALDRHDPDHILRAAIDGIQVDAQLRYLALMPKDVA